MSLNGRLEEVALPELLQFISYNGKTGKLTLSRRDGQGVMVFRAGRIIYAATNSVRESFGNILVRRGLIDEATLLEALQMQSRHSEERRLGAILIEMGRVSPQDLEKVMRHQTEVVLAELFQWTGGFFRFEPMEIRDGGEVQVDAREFVVDGGIGAEHLLLELAARLDESSRVAGGAGDSSRFAGTHQRGSGGQLPEPPASLRAIITDLHAPALRAEITLTIMRYASQVVGRGVLLVVRGDVVIANGHFGVETAAAGLRPAIADLELSLAVPSVFREVVERKQSFEGALAEAPGNNRFLRCLGHPPPRESLVVPMVVDENVAMMLYGDNAPESRPLTGIESLELLMAESGLAMEKRALEARIEHLERARHGG